jgi:hypothetical protein
MEEILIVPDVHGRIFWQPALEYKGAVIFLGDYTDPYSSEGFTQEDAYNGLLKIVEFKKQNPDRVTLLVGNHDMHYYNRRYACGRFDAEYFQAYNDIFMGEETTNLFQLCKQSGHYLFIHAGVTKGWYDAHFEEFSKLGNNLEEQLNKLFITNMDAFHEASKYRGGYHDAGSPLWADYDEFCDEEEKGEYFDNDIIQIIGHTQLKKDEPLTKGKCHLLDNRQLYLLKDNKITKWKK